MLTFRDRLKEINAEIKRLGSVGKVLRWGAYGLLTWVVGKAVDMVTDQWISQQLSWLWHQVKDSAKEPVGVVWLLLAVFLTISLIVSLSFVFINAWWETRPRKDSQRQPLTLDERAIAQPLRNLWNLYGKEAANALSELARHIQNNWRLKDRYSGLLNHPLGDLDMGIKEMTEAVSDDTQLRAEEIHERFNRLYGDAYRPAVFWVAQIVEHQDYVQPQPQITERLLGKWAGAQQRFYDEIKEVNEIPEHRGQLQFGGGFLDEMAGRFLHKRKVEL
jgi:hypothetical protein